MLQEAGSSQIFRADMEAAAWPAHYKRVSSGRGSGSKGTKEDGGPGTQAAFCFAVSDGRLGSITVTDRGVKKRPVTAPHWTVTYVDRLVVTSIAAIGDLVFIGDSDGILYQWNTATGKTMVVPAGMKVIRKIALGPPGSPVLDPRRGAAQDLARLVLLYGDGSLGVRSGGCSAASASADVVCVRLCCSCMRPLRSKRRSIGVCWWSQASHASCGCC